jgi:hypothetical protein
MEPMEIAMVFVPRIVAEDSVHQDEVSGGGRGRGLSK